MLMISSHDGYHWSRRQHQRAYGRRDAVTRRRRKNAREAEMIYLYLAWCRELIDIWGSCSLLRKMAIQMNARTFDRACYATMGNVMAILSVEIAHIFAISRYSRRADDSLR